MYERICLVCESVHWTAVSLHACKRTDFDNKYMKKNLWKLNELLQNTCNDLIDLMTLIMPT